MEQESIENVLASLKENYTSFFFPHFFPTQTGTRSRDWICHGGGGESDTEMRVRVSGSEKTERQIQQKENPTSVIKNSMLTSSC